MCQPLIAIFTIRRRIVLGRRLYVMLMRMIAVMRVDRTRDR
jgi:hypothetical protein